jgi:membrane-bound lytic murein transglycosylase A
MMRTMKRLLLLTVLLLVSGCGLFQSKPSEQGAINPSCKCEEASAKPEVFKLADYSLLKTAQWNELDDLAKDDLTQAWPAWVLGCAVLKNKPAWQKVCTEAEKITAPNQENVHEYLRKNFAVYRATNLDNSETGLITGYYEPILKASRTKKGQYRYPLYARPDDLITVELASIFPELANKRVRGRVVGNKLIPYFNRGEIEADQSPLKGREIAWVDDQIDLFFLQIQGSGMLHFDNGEKMHVGYADQNGQSYQSIGRLLIDKGEITADKASMQGIKNWAKNNPKKVRELLNANPSYVFFRELPADLPGPIGALGSPILAERVVAVDPKFVPLGAPIFLSTNLPFTSQPLQRLMMAQDTGGAIKGGVRADFYWGAGNEAGKQAGSMKQSGKIWVLLPKDFVFPKANGNGSNGAASKSAKK